MAKKIYIGAPATNTVIVDITSENISQYFSVENGELTFVGNGGTFVASNTDRYIANSIKLTALKTFDVSFDYTLIGFAAQDTFVVTVADTVVCSLKDGDDYPVTHSWSGTLAAGQSIELVLTPNGRVWTGDDLEASFQNMVVTTYSEKNEEVAHKVKKLYVGILSDVPIYSVTDITDTITYSNINDFFEVTSDPLYYFTSNAVLNTIFKSNNSGAANTTAKTTLKALYDMTLSFDYSYSSEANYDKFTLAIAGTVVENGVSGSTTNKSWSGTLTAGQEISFTYSKDGSQNKNDDQCTFSNMVVSCTKRIQTGTEQREVARRIKKAYIGIGGVARPCFSNGELAYYGVITSLSEGKSEIPAASIGGKALFAGGCKGGSSYLEYVSNIVDVYNSSLVHSTVTIPSPYPSYNTKGASNSKYAVFAGGWGYYSSGNTVSYINSVYGYDSDLTFTAANTDLDEDRVPAAGSIGDYAVFAGGDSNASSGSTDVEAYDANLSRITCSSLSYYTTQRMTAASTKTHVLFGGGEYFSNDTVNSSLYAYNENLTKVEVSDNLYDSEVGYGRSRAGGASAGNGTYAIFAGGYYYRLGTKAHSSVYAYDESLTRTIIEPLSVARFFIDGNSLGNYAVFAGGFDDDDSYDTVDVYDGSLVKTIFTPLNERKHNTGSAVAGDYLIFAGGEASTTTEYLYYDTVEAYTI